MVVVEVCGNNSRPLLPFPLLQCLRKVCFFHIITSNVRICLLLCWANPPFSDSIFELFLRQRSTDFFSTVMLLYRSQKVKLLFGSSFSCSEIKNSRFLLYFFFEDHDVSVKLITFVHPIIWCLLSIWYLVLTNRILTALWKSGQLLYHACYDMLQQK